MKQSAARHFKTNVQKIQDRSQKKKKKNSIWLPVDNALVTGSCHNSAEVSHPLKYGANKDRMSQRLRE